MYQSSVENQKKSFILDVCTMSFGGHALAKLDGKVFFIKDAFPGDRVVAEVVEDKKKFAFAKITKILKSSSLRAIPNCRYQDSCGGCQWQSLQYKSQSAFKKEFIIDLFRKISKVDLEKYLLFYSSSLESNYRNRVLLRGTIENNKIGVGFFESSSHKQIHIDNCSIANKKINSLIKKLSSCSLNKNIDLQKFRLEIQFVQSHAISNGKLLVTIFPGQKNSDLSELLLFLKKTSEVEWVGYVSDQKNSDFFLLEGSNKIKYFTKPGVFQQINFSQNEILRNCIQNFVETYNVESILDLYCGSGNLSLHLANSKRTIIGVENNSKSIEVANHNIKQNSLEGTNYICANVKSFLKNESKVLSKMDMIIIDPPRKGCKDEVPMIMDLNPEYIIYVSCNPSTCARDFSMLKSLYSIVKVYGFDFFPQTYHVETMLILKKINN